MFFFFQAEDGIRDLTVTGVQTCALPIFSYLFRQVGQFVFAPGTSEDRVMEAALDAGAEDVLKNDDGSVELICAPADFATVKAALQKAGLKPELAEITMKPNAESSLAGDEAASLRRLLEALENLDDVQDVYTTPGTACESSASIPACRA